MTKYPFVKGNIKTNPINHSNRGMSFESRINQSNEYYKKHDVALIFKRYTPIKTIDVDTSTATINKATFKEKSTTDYYGLYKGVYVDFEAKSTRNKVSFPLENLKYHQIEHLKEVDRLGGISFLLIEFSLLDEIYILKTKDLVKFLSTSKLKSIPYSYIKTKGFLVDMKINILVDYLENFEKIFEISRVFCKK